jgi:molybdopterin-binding protein
VDHGPDDRRAAAEKLGVGYSTMKRWIGDGRVRTTLTEGGHHRISDAEIDRLTTTSQPAGQGPRRAAGDPDDTLAGLSARNRLLGFVEEVRIDGLLAQVRLRVGNQTLTAVVTADAIHALKLKRVTTRLAVIKSTEVMIAKPVNPNGRRAKRRESRAKTAGCA